MRIPLIAFLQFVLVVPIFAEANLNYRTPKLKIRVQTLDHKPVPNAILKYSLSFSRHGWYSSCVYEPASKPGFCWKDQPLIQENLVTDPEGQTTLFENSFTTHKASDRPLPKPVSIVFDRIFIPGCEKTPPLPGSDQIPTFLNQKQKTQICGTKWTGIEIDRLPTSITCTLPINSEVFENYLLNAREACQAN